jgi:hypothetical protein
MDSELFEARCQEVRAAAAPAGCDRCDHACASQPVRDYRKIIGFEEWVEHCDQCDLYRLRGQQARTLFELRNRVNRATKTRRLLDSNRRLIRERRSVPIVPVPTLPEPGVVVWQDDHECLIVEYTRP